MDLMTFFTVFLTLFFLILAFFSFNLYKLKYNIEKRLKEKETNAALSFQREQLETEVYHKNEKLMESRLRFEEANHLFYTNMSDICLSKHVIDQSFFQDMGIALQDIKVEENEIICLIPFHKTFFRLYALIKETCSNAHFNCTRSDDEFVTGNIVKHTVELILKSQIVIAVMDGRNPNVFYEIGIAHSIGKTVILISDYSKMEEIPFNLRTNRFIFYKNPNDLSKQLYSALMSVRNDTGGEEK